MEYVKMNPVSANRGRSVGMIWVMSYAMAEPVCKMMMTWSTWLVFSLFERVFR